MPDHTFHAARDDSRLPHAGTYRRVLPVSLERLYENALDWEHLPHVHGASFAGIRSLAVGPAGWRAAVTAADGRESVLELALERDHRRWITRVADGFGAGAEIWTHAFLVDPARVDIVVDFFVPGLAATDRLRVGESYARLYARLYDEDVAMMTERQRQLDRRLERARDAERTLVLGLRNELALPLDITVGGREFVLADVEGTLVAFPRQCPHQLGPLSAAGLRGRVVKCPWHGDRFDVLTGANLSGRCTKLAHLPEVRVDGYGRVEIHAVH